MVKDVVFINISMPILWRYIYNIVFIFFINIFGASLGGSDDKESASSVGDTCSIPGSGRSPGEGNGNPLQYSCLENPMDGGAWRATVFYYYIHYSTQTAWTKGNERNQNLMITYYGLNAELDILHVQLYSIFLIMLWYGCCFPHFINEATDSSKLLTCVTFLNVWNIWKLYWVGFFH